ncbi:MAG: acyltransferase [Bacteroidales bacterium]|nr:acyltransferase [Bacteroidales bacterium]
MNHIIIGKSCRFSGIPRIVRFPKSQIIIGKNCNFKSYSGSNLVGINHKCNIVTLNSKAKITVGDNSGFSGVVIAAAQRIIIGNNVLLGANVTVTDTDWHSSKSKNRNISSDVNVKPIYIENNVWIGLNSVVLKGVKIGENSIITPNSVVHKDIPANCIAGGNPCIVIKQIDI